MQPGHFCKKVVRIKMKVKQEMINLELQGQTEPTFITDNS